MGRAFSSVAMQKTDHFPFYFCVWPILAEHFVCVCRKTLHSCDILSLFVLNKFDINNSSVQFWMDFSLLAKDQGLFS